MAAINFDEDEVLMNRFNEVEWVDMGAQYQCTRCQKVLVQHYVSNCAHKFCANCKRILDDGSHRWRCPECQQFITDMGRQDFEFKDKVFKLRVHCPNRKYGCQHICSFKDLKEHLKCCEHTKERALPVLYEGAITPEMVERMLSFQLSELRNEMREQMTEMRKVCDERDNESNRKLREEVDQLKQKMTEIEKKRKEGKLKLKTDLFMINDRVDGVKSDLTVETTRLRNDIKEIQKNQPMRSDSLNSESVSLAVEENKSRIIKLEAKTETWIEMVEVKDRKNIELINQLKKEMKKKIKTKIAEVKETMSEMKTEQEKEWAETKDRVDQCCVDINHLKEKAEIQKAEVEVVKTETDKKIGEILKTLDKTANKMETEVKLRDIKAEVETIKINNKKETMEEINKETNDRIKKEVIEESKRYADGKVKEMISPLSKKLDEKMSECNEKITTIEKTIRDNQLIPNSKLQQKMFHLETSILLRNPQMNAFSLAEDKCNFQPNFRWKISGLEEKLKQTTFEIKSEAFTWTGYPVQAQVKMEVKQDGDVWVSLCLKEINEGKVFHLKLIPVVYYVLRDRSGNRDTKHTSRSITYLFTSTFDFSLTFERQLTHKSWLTNKLYNADDSIVVEVYVEQPSMTQLVHSYDGTLVWAIANYRKRKEMEKEQLVRCQESPYFYTAPNGYRVQVLMWLNGFGEYKGKGLLTVIYFLPGEFDADLPSTFPHRTTITLFNRKDPQRNITKTVDEDIQTKKEYLIDMCSDKEIENVIENDTVFFKVTIKPKN